MNTSESISSDKFLIKAFLVWAEFNISNAENIYCLLLFFLLGEQLTLNSRQQRQRKGKFW